MSPGGKQKLAYADLLAGIEPDSPRKAIKKTSDVHQQYRKHKETHGPRRP